MALPLRTCRGKTNRNKREASSQRVYNLSFAHNLRFPGQYYDVETAKHYNYFRDYSPSIGRYIQSDPIGLRGGLNTYGYVKGEPLRFTDRKGRALDAFWCSIAPGAPECLDPDPYRRPPQPDWIPQPRPHGNCCDNAKIFACMADDVTKMVDCTLCASRVFRDRICLP